MSDRSPLFTAVLHGDLNTALAEVRTRLEQGDAPQGIMDEHLIPAMEEAGRLFEESEFFVPDLMIAARAMQESLKILDPLLKQTGVEKIGRVVIGTVQGDHHDIGKNLVASMLEGGGFEVVDLGVDVPARKFIEIAREKEGTIIALSALLTTTMSQMKRVVEALREAGLEGKTKVMIGGAPVSSEFAQEIGADGYSENASSAVALAKQLAV